MEEKINQKGWNNSTKIAHKLPVYAQVPRVQDWSGYDFRFSIF